RRMQHNAIRICLLERFGRPGSERRFDDRNAAHRHMLDHRLHDRIVKARGCCRRRYGDKHDLACFKRLALIATRLSNPIGDNRKTPALKIGGIRLADKPLPDKANCRLRHFRLHSLNIALFEAFSYSRVAFKSAAYFSTYSSNDWYG